MSILGTSAAVLPITSSDVGAADIGAFYVAVEPTPGTGVIGPASVTTFDETKAIMCLYNGSASLNYALRWIRLQVTTAGAGATQVQFTQALDQGNRYSSGGSVLTVNNTNMAQPNSSGAQLNFGALTTTSASGVRRVIGHTIYGTGKTAWGLANETYQLSFGSPNQLEDPCSLINNSTTLAHATYNYPPVIIGPNQSYTLHTWASGATTGITCLVECAFMAK